MRGAGRRASALMPRDLNADTSRGSGPVPPRKSADLSALAGRENTHGGYGGPESARAHREVVEWTPADGRTASQVARVPSVVAGGNATDASALRSATRYSRFKSVHDLVEDTISSRAWGGRSVHASVDLDGHGWRSGYVPKDFDRRSARNRRVSSSINFGTLPSSLRSGASSPTRQPPASLNRRESVIKELNFDAKADRNSSLDVAIDKLHSGLDMVLGKQNEGMAALVRQIQHIRKFWQKRRPNVRIHTMADLVNDIKIFTESVQSQKAHYRGELSLLKKENEGLRKALEGLKERETLGAGEEERLGGQLADLAAKLESAEANEGKVLEVLNAVRQENSQAGEMLQQALGESVESTSAPLLQLAESMVAKMGSMETEIEGFRAAQERLETEMEEQKKLLSQKERELQTMVDEHQSEAMEVECQYEQMEGLVKKIEEAEVRMQEQATLCSALQGQITHLKVDRENSLQAKDAMELMQEQWEDERAAFLEEIEELKLKCEVDEPKDFLSQLSEDFRKNLLDLLELLNDPQLLRENKDLVSCLGKIRDNIFERCAQGQESAMAGDGPDTPSKRTFGEKLEYFQGVGSVLSSPYPAFNSPQVMEGIKARMNVEKQRQAKMSADLSRKIADATKALKAEFQKHVTGYESRIEELEDELAHKTELLQRCSPGSRGHQITQIAEETYDLSILPEEWEDALLSVLTEAALCPEQDWSDMLQGKERMIKDQHASHMESLMERLKFDFQEEVLQLNEAIEALEANLDGWQFVPDQSPLHREDRVILQQRVISSMHRLQVVRQLASLGNTLVDPSMEVSSYISSSIQNISYTETTEADVNEVLLQSWKKAVRGMKIISGRLTSSEGFPTSVSAWPLGKKPSQARSENSASTSAAPRRRDTVAHRKRSGASVIPCGSMMNFSPGDAFLPGEREANLKMGQPSLKEILGPKAPTTADIHGLKEELLEYFKEDDGICDLIRTIGPCREKHLEGSFKFGTRSIKLVILNDLLMVRIGGGFETFEQYFAKHYRLEVARLHKQNSAQK